MVLSLQINVLDFNLYANLINLFFKLDLIQIGDHKMDFLILSLKHASLLIIFPIKTNFIR